ncbi:unnamed protein product [Echinostoma caproni]|uniref:Coiled-coil domain-containing protein 22 homolog n=1 Tax=Echinostoma caproni TaxID=27848 RepID=A0A183AKA5_9TREM|nr:unnamed protein product [Echinostoma caproni]
MRTAKTRYAELLEVVAEKEKQLTALRVERRAKQSTVDQLTRHVEEITVSSREIQKLSNEAEAQISLMKTESANAKKQSETLRDEIVLLKKEFEACNDRLLHDIESIPRMMSEKKQQLEEVENEIHRIFQVRNSAMDQITGFNKFQPLLDQLKEVLGETEEWMKKHTNIHQTEKEKLNELEQIKRKFEEVQSEKNELTHALMDLQSELMRCQLLLANKKKAIQANEKSTMEEIEAFNSDARKVQQRIKQLQQQCDVYEDQLKLEQEGIKEMSMRIKQADRLGRQLLELRKELSESQ